MRRVALYRISLYMQKYHPCIISSITTTNEAGIRKREVVVKDWKIGISSYCVLVRGGHLRLICCAQRSGVASSETVVRTKTYGFSRSYVDGRAFSIPYNDTTRRNKRYSNFVGYHGFLHDGIEARMFDGKIEKLKIGIDIGFVALHTTYSPGGLD